MDTFPYYSTIWDDGFLSGGNYWSDYTGVDVNNEDGIGDTPYIIDSINFDNYPLICPFYTFNAGTWYSVIYHIDVVSNSSISDFYFNPEEGAFLRFSVTGESGTTGFCRVTIPRGLMYGEGHSWIIELESQSVNQIALHYVQETSLEYIVFTYTHNVEQGTLEIRGTNAIPEFPSWIILPLFIVATLVVMIGKNKLRKKGLE